MADFVAAFFVCLLINYSSSKSAAKKDVIGFPEVEENPNMKNKENRQPVYLPAMCPVNELYYPGDQKDDWICDCRPSHIYHPPSDACWPAFKRGPCPEGDYLVLPVNSVLPICQRNPCYVDGYVLWNGRCEKLGSLKPCGDLFPYTTAISVNATNLAIDCEKLDLESRFGEPVPTNTNNQVQCPPGCRRRIDGKCNQTPSK